MDSLSPQPLIRGSTRLYGIFGDPLGHTLSPAMHNAGFAEAGIDAVYVPVPLNRDQLLSLAPHLPMLFQGFNVTVPHKEVLMPEVSTEPPVDTRPPPPPRGPLYRVDAESSWIGAINTVVCREGCMEGFNTDWKGFRETVERDFVVSVRKRSVMILGAGGSAKACLYACFRMGASEVILVNRTRSRAESLAARARTQGMRMRVLSPGDPEITTALASAALVVNSTSLGLQAGEPHWLRFPQSDSKPFVMDLVYSRSPTAFLEQARAAGYPAGDGRGMLVRQALHAFSIWTNREANPETFCRAAGFDYRDGRIS